MPSKAPFEEDITKLFQGYGNALFESHCKFALDSTLNPWAKDILTSNTYPLIVQEYNNPLILFFEDRATETLRFTILNSLIMCRLKMRGILFTVPSKVEIMKDLLSDIKDWVDIIPIKDKDIETFAGVNYSNLLKRKSFWGNIPAKKVLIVHSDALLIEPIDFSIFKYDNIGAPWSAGKHLSFSVFCYSKSLMMEAHRQWFTLVFNKNQDMLDGKIIFGNGGLTVRDTSKMIEMCNLEPSTDDEPEDIYFSRLLTENKGNLPSVKQARAFACETEYFDSFGAHASHIYLKCEDQARIYSRHFSHLTGIVVASYRSKSAN